MVCKSVYYNGKIYTMDEEVPFANWVAVDQGKIVAMGEGEVPQTIEAQRCIDLKKSTMLPGLFDSHMHGTNTGESIDDVNLANVKSIKEALDKISRRAEATAEGEWITCSSYDYSVVQEKRAILCTELDEVSKGHPVYIKNMTLHGCTLNSKAMEIINIPDNLMGIVKDTKGNRTGEFSSDDSANYVANKIHELTKDEILERFIEKCASWCASKGCTTISGLDGGLYDSSDRDFFLWMLKEKELPIHVEHFFQRMNVPLARALGLPRIGGCICLDGAGFEGTMATRKPYNDGPYPTGILYYTDEQVYDFMWKASKAGMQIAMHALGDAAIDQYLRCYERVYKELGLQGNPNHNRIEHFTMVHPEHIKKAIGMDLILSMQPKFTWLWGGDDEGNGNVYTTMSGDDDVEFEPFRKIYEAGGIIAGGSDSPVTPVDPLGGIHALVNMPKTSNRLPITEAIKVFTINGAIANNVEHERGSITVGKLADFTVVDRDPYEDSDSIKDFKVLKTIVEDKLVYEG